MGTFGKGVILAACASLAAALPAVAADTIKVGAILAVTGPAAFLGGPEARTLEMLRDEINGKGGINGSKIELVIKDSQGKPENAISFAKQLIEEEQVFAIIGPSTSGETMQIKNIAEEGKTILLSCAAAESIVKPVAKYVFKTPQSDRDAVLKIFEQLKKIGKSKVGVLSSNTGFGDGGKKLIEALAPTNGLTVVASEVYDKAATDLTAEVTKIKAAGVEAVINWSIEPAQAIVLKNIRQLGLDVPVFQSHGFGNIKYVEAAGAAAEGVLFPAGRLLVAESLPDANPQKAVLLKYKKDYEGKFKEEASTFGGHAYDALLILSKAVEVAGTDREKVRDAIEGLKGVVGTGGVFNFSAEDHNGLGIDAFEMLTVKAGTFIPLQ